jgi:hypothetical protein
MITSFPIRPSVEASGLADYLERPNGVFHPVARAAAVITLTTAAGSAIIDRCPACTLVMCACIRWAMNSSMADGIARSIVPSTYQLGTVFHAGVPEGAVSAL